MNKQIAPAMVKWFRWSGLSVVLLLLIVQTKPFALGALNQGKSLLMRAKRSLSAQSSDWQEQKVTASDGAAQDNLGWSVAIDGNTAVVGAPNATINGHSSQGAAYIFSNSNGSWAQVAKLTANDGASFDTFGYSVAISGNTAVVGAWHSTINGNPLQGAAYVFTYADGQWSEQAKLTANDGVAFDAFGYSVALNGTTALVGAPDASGKINDSGAAYVFDGSGGTWNQVQKLAGSDGASGDQFGYKVALHGVVAVIGAPFADIGTNTEQGAGYVFNQDKGNWAEIQKLITSDGVSHDNAGFAVATSASSAALGVPSANIGGHAYQGAVYFYQQPET